VISKKKNSITKQSSVVINDAELISILQALPIGIFIHQKGKCLFANAEACKILEENSIKHIIGKYLVDYIIPNQVNLSLDRIKRELRGEVLDNKTYLIKTAKKNEVEVALKTTNVFFNGINCVQTTMTNVSAEKKLAEESLRARLAEKTNDVLVNVIRERNATEAKLNTIFNTSTHIIWTVDKNFKLSSFNQNYYNQIFDFYNKTLVIGLDYKKLYKSIFNKSDYIYWISKFESAFKGENIVFETKKLLDNGDYIYREIFLNPTFDNNGTVSEIVAISHNITERKTNEIKAQEQSAKLLAIFESSSHLIWTVDKEFNLTECNNNFIKIFQDNYNATPILKKQVHLVLPKEKQQTYKSYWYDLYNKVLNGNSLKFEHTQFTLKGEYSVKEIYLNAIRNTNNEIVEIACLAHDITENKIFEKQILEQSAKLKAIFESGDQLMWSITKDRIITSFNQNYSKSVFDLYGYYPEIGKAVGSDNSIKYHPYWDDKYMEAFSGKKVEFISERKTLKGEVIVRQMILNPIKDAFNNVIEVSGIGFDITENKKNEERVSQSLKEKEILLKEVHHRVKNNMQVISSILNLQSSYVKDEYALSLLKECQNRIKSMAYIHESLYQTKNFEGVNFSEYISTLSKNLVHTYSVNTKNVKLVLNLSDLFLNLDLSIPCGLIINEIISNSLKYAFPSKKGGIIFVNLTVKNKLVNIEIGDNGIGMPDHIDIKQTQTLGLQLVDTLIEQIDGSLKLERINGTKFIIKFKI
jgi:PAS domain S-box-containing protein